MQKTAKYTGHPSTQNNVGYMNKYLKQSKYATIGRVLPLFWDQAPIPKPNT